MILDQIITNFPSSIWLREVSDESFNEALAPAAQAVPQPRAIAAAEFGYEELVVDLHADTSLPLPLIRLTARQAD